MGRIWVHRQNNQENEEEKPLKLVLKVGGSNSVDTLTSDHDERKHKHKKKKKKKDKQKDKEHVKQNKHCGVTDETHIGPTEICDSDNVNDDMEPIAKRALFEAEQQLALDGDSEGVQLMNPPSQGLIRLLNLQHASLQRKDVNSFFAYPVTDAIAPGYSLKITNPMDMSTMKSKIESGQYRCVQQYLEDFQLMCDNCTSYNRPDTIFYKEAKRMNAIASRQLSKEKLLLMRSGNVLLTSVTADELGIDESELKAADKAALYKENYSTSMQNPNDLINSSAKHKSRSKLGAWEYDLEDEEEITAEVILAQAKAAAANAKEMLTLRAPNSKIGFLRRETNGSTSLNILNPDNDGMIDEKTRVVDLGTLTSKIHSGLGQLTSFKEDKRNKITPVTSLNYGPFCAYAPSYDSTFANINKEQSDLLLNTYGDDVGLEYAKSINAFASNSCDYTIDVVDSLLDILTDGKHSETIVSLRQKDVENAQMNEAVQMMDPDFTDSKFTQDNISNQINGNTNNVVPPSETAEVSTEVSKLEQTADLLGQLQQTQYERLNQTVPHLSMLPPPSEHEQQLAGEVSNSLTEMIKEVGPGDIAQSKDIRNAMGITNEPLEGNYLQNQIIPNTEPMSVDNNDKNVNNSFVLLPNSNAMDTIPLTTHTSSTEGMILQQEAPSTEVVDSQGLINSNQSTSTLSSFNQPQNNVEVEDDETAAAVAALGNGGMEFSSESLLDIHQ